MIGKTSNRGYAFVTSLIILAIVSALVVGFVQQVNTEQKIGRNDLDYSGAFYAAEAGLEKLNADLSKIFLQSVFPSSAQVAAIQGTSYRPALTNATFTTYSLIGGQSTRLAAAIASTGTLTSVTVQSTSGWPATGFFMIDGEEFTYTGISGNSFTGITRAANSSIMAAHIVNATVSRSAVVTISEGHNAGLTAQTIPFTLEIVASAGVGSEAKLTREVQVALIPVFQFGVFSDSDLSFFAGPNFNFGGRVHSNSTLYLAEGDNNTLTLSHKVTTAGEVIRNYLSNDVTVTNSHNGTVSMMKTPGTYRSLAQTEGSLTGSPGNWAVNSSWPTLSLTTYNGNILSGTTGGKPLTLPFAGGGASPIEIIRRPCYATVGTCAAVEDPASILGQSRLFNQASVRVLISDSAAYLPGGVGYPLNANLTGGPWNYTVGAAPFRPPFAVADPTDADFVTAANADETTNAPLVDGFILIEYQRASDNAWIDVTMEILNYGIATNQADAIVRLQRLKTGAAATSTTATDYWPINMYDVREGRVRDSSIAGIRKLGIMNLVELDVNNLRLWLARSGAYAAGSGDQVISNNGYIFYFSDRRGNRDASASAMSAGNETGEFGFEDIVNPADPTNGAVDATLNTGEDFNGNGLLDVYGAKLPYSPYVAGNDLYNTMLGASASTLITGGNINNSITTITVASTAAFPAAGYITIDSEVISYTGKTGTTFTGCTRAAFNTPAAGHNNGVTVSVSQQGLKNRVHYFRRALRLINGAAPNLPTPGFTVAAENPVYVRGNYNANGNFTGAHSYAAIIADAVTLLSGNWTDERSFEIPYVVGSRPAATTWYRMAIASGKGITFPRPGNPTPNDFGTDGGVHNFLKYLESWSGQTSNYRGSIVSLYYARQGIGTYKCCTIVYSPPTRSYAFDTEFLVPSQLPPGTPRFRDINNLAFRQTVLSH